MIDNTLIVCCANGVSSGFGTIRPEQRAYGCHPGGEPGLMCTFQLDRPPRAMALPYSALLSVDALGDALITLRYAHADVDVALVPGYAARDRLWEDLCAFRVASLRVSAEVRIEIRTPSLEERPEVF